MQKAQRATGMKFALGMVMRCSPHFRKLHYYRAEGACDHVGGHAGGARIMHAEFAATIVDGAPPCAGMRDGINSCLPAYAADEALATGRVVDIRPYWKKAGMEWSVL